MTTPFGLHQMKIFEGIPSNELDPIRKLCEEVVYPYDTELAFDGDDSKFVFLLRKGKTELIARHPETSKKVVIARKEPGETMGFSSLIQPYQLNFIIHCLETCEMYRIPRARLLQEQRRNPTLYEKLRHRIAKHVFPNLQKALDKLQEESSQESWYPQEEDLDSPGPKDGEIL
jgi:signal-transduction protein with cAMP-binding, CBS, and nucleotidyltransferase domain